MDIDPFDTILYQSPRVTVSRFCAHPTEPRFHDSGPARFDCFVFPISGVRIQHTGGEPLLTSPNVVMFYNRGQTYVRDRLGPAGDICDWFSIERGAMREALRFADPAAADREDNLFRLTQGPSDARTYLLQRLVVRHLREAETVDPLFVEETALRLIERVLANAVRAQKLPGAKFTKDRPEPDHLDQVAVAEDLLVRRFHEPLTLDDIARQTGGSVFHLARLFRRRTGFPLHVFRNQLRLRTALEAVAQPGADLTDLTDLALDLGFSSHSHFTAAFRQAFGIAPSALRKTATGRRVRELAEKIKL